MDIRYGGCILVLLVFPVLVLKNINLPISKTLLTMTITMTKFNLKIKTSFEVYKRYIYVQI